MSFLAALFYIYVLLAVFDFIRGSIIEDSAPRADREEE